MLRVVCQCISGFSCWHDLPCLGSVRTKAAFVRAMWVPLIHTETNSAPTGVACARTAATAVGVDVVFVHTEASFVRIEVALVRASWLVCFLGAYNCRPSSPPAIAPCIFGVYNCRPLPLLALRPVISGVYSFRPSSLWARALLELAPRL